VQRQKHHVEHGLDDGRNAAEGDGARDHPHHPEGDSHVEDDLTGGACGDDHARSLASAHETD
jgi:hypothetical protein